MKWLMLSMLVLSVGMTLHSCGGNSNQAEKSGPEYDSAYICPMHCEGSGSAEAGICPVCGMDYVVNEDFKGEVNVESKTEDHDHEGHDRRHSVLPLDMPY